MTASDPAPGRNDWAGPRPLVGARPALVALALAIVLVAVLAVALRREVGIPAQVAAHYVALMAGALDDEGEGAIRRAAAEGALPFVPVLGSLEPDFTLAGRAVRRLADRPSAVWFYRSSRFDMVLAEAFRGTLADLGTPDEIRRDPPPVLHVFRKTTQTLVFWQEGREVYVFTSTMPGERTIALARRLAAQTAGTGAAGELRPPETGVKR